MKISLNSVSERHWPAKAPIRPIRIRLRTWNRDDAKQVLVEDGGFLGAVDYFGGVGEEVLLEGFEVGFGVFVVVVEVLDEGFAGAAFL